MSPSPDSERSDLMTSSLLYDDYQTSRPIPVNLLKQVANELAPYLAEMFNRSLTAGYFPAVHKVAYITPLLKKRGLDATDVRSGRPISSLSIVSKLVV
jgi:hypothetical protein